MLGQLLRLAAVLQPGTHMPGLPLQIMPEVAFPHSLSPSDASQPHVPLDAMHCGFVPVHSDALVFEHSPQAPLGWQAGVDPPQSVSSAHARQLPIGSQMGVLPEQSLGPVQAPQV